jgi:hypothetical protein
MLPRVKIYFENGALGSIAPSADGVVGLVCTGATVIDGLQLATPYILRTLDDLVALGVSSGDSDANAFLYKHVSEFFAETGEDSELWIMCFPNTVIQSELTNQTQNYAKALIQAANGKIRVMAVAFNPSNDYEPTITDGVDADLFGAASHAQALAEWATNTMFAPLTVILEARSFNGAVTALADLATNAYNRVGILLGDTAPSSTGAAVGLLLGRIARIPVQRHIGRVRDGAVKTLTAYIGNTPVESADVESINDKGYITLRTFTGISGYFFADDSLATSVTDDYRSIARRRTIDKAYRIAYATLVEFLNDEIPITDNGGLVPAMAKSWENEVESAIISQMAAEGNLGIDTTDPNDKGVKCFIDYNQNVVSNNKVEISLKVKPYGYAKYIDVKLGFITINN